MTNTERVPVAYETAKEVKHAIIDLLSDGERPPFIDEDVQSNGIGIGMRDGDHCVVFDGITDRKDLLSLGESTHIYEDVLVVVSYASDFPIAHSGVGVLSRVRDALSRR